MDSFATSLRPAVTRLLLLAALLLPAYAFASYYTYASLCGHDGTCDTQEGALPSAFASVTGGYVGVSLGSGTIKLLINEISPGSSGGYLEDTLSFIGPQGPTLGGSLATLSVDVHGALSGPYANVNVGLLIDGSLQGRVCVSSDSVCTGSLGGPNSLTNVQGLFDQTMTYNFFPGSPMDLLVSIAGNAGPGSTANLSNTVGIGLDLPTGWSYSSASGVFLQQTGSAVPEPNSVSLFVLCLLGLAGVHWRRSMRWHQVRAHTKVTA